jgi:hypothetical protein
LRPSIDLQSGSIASAFFGLKEILFGSHLPFHAKVHVRRQKVAHLLV